MRNHSALDVARFSQVWFYVFLSSPSFAKALCKGANESVKDKYTGVALVMRGWRKKFSRCYCWRAGALAQQGSGARVCALYKG